MNQGARPRLDGAEARAMFLIAMIFPIALNLRPTLTSVGPLLPQLGAELQLTESVQGLLGAVPLVALAVISPLVHFPARRFGVERALLAALLGIALGALIRSYGGNIGLWLGTAVLGCGIAFGNVLVPTMVRRDYSRHIARATSIYSACITLGAAVASAVAFPMAQWWGWRGSLAFWAIPAVVVALMWLPRLRRPRTAVGSVRDGDEPIAPTADQSHPTRSPWRQRVAWLITAFMGLQSTSFYVVVNWLPTIALSVGMTPEGTGVLLFVYQLAGLVGVLAAPRLIRGDNVLIAALVASGSMASGLFGIVALPGLIFGWILLIGAGSGASLVVALSLISLRGSGDAGTTRLSGMVQSVGYLVAAVGPIAAGVMAERTGGWTLSLLMLALLAVVQVLVSIAIGRDRRPVEA